MHFSFFFLNIRNFTNCWIQNEHKQHTNEFFFELHFLNFPFLCQNLITSFQKIPKTAWNYFAFQVTFFKNGLTLLIFFNYSQKLATPHITEVGQPAVRKTSLLLAEHSITGNHYDSFYWGLLMDITEGGITIKTKHIILQEGSTSRQTGFFFTRGRDHSSVPSYAYETRDSLTAFTVTWRVDRTVCGANYCLSETNSSVLLESAKKLQSCHTCFWKSEQM